MHENCILGFPKHTNKFLKLRTILSTKMQLKKIKKKNSDKFIHENHLYAIDGLRVVEAWKALEMDNINLHSPSLPYNIDFFFSKASK